MNLLSTAAAFVVALGVLIVFHEFGHYLVARLCGVKVLRFSVGFGNPLWSRRLGRDGTEWAVALIPLGGYVKMLDEREAPVPPEQRHRAFNRQSVWRRIAIVSAGPVANFLLAVLLYWVLLVHGIPGVRPVVGEPAAGTPAAAARFESGDILTAVDGAPVRTWQELRWRLLDKALARGTAEVQVETDRGEARVRSLDLSALDSDELDAEFLQKLGFGRYQPPLPPVIGKVVAGSVAESAGLREGDEILAADGAEVERWDQLVEAVRARPGQPVDLEVLRDGTRVPVTLIPAEEVENGRKVGRVGIGPRMDEAAARRYVTEVSYGPVAAIGEAVRRTWEASAFTVQMLWKMVLGQVSLKNLSGPITIADYAGQSAQMGWLAYVSFLALISISLGVLNLLPVPLLDGGHLMYYLAEIIKGSPVSERSLEIGQRVGMVVLFSLMAFAIFNDINRLFGGS